MQVDGGEESCFEGFEVGAGVSGDFDGGIDRKLIGFDFPHTDGPVPKDGQANEQE